MHVTESDDQLKIAAVRSEHAVVLVLAIVTLLVVTYAAGEFTRWASGTWGIDEGIIPLMLIVYLLLPVLVSRLQPTRFSPLFRYLVIPAVAVVQAAFAIYRQSSIVFNGEEYVFDARSGKVEQNGDEIGRVDRIEAVEQYRNTFPTIGDTFNIKLLMADAERIEVGVAVRSEREAKRISGRIARFLDVPLIELGEMRDRAETIGSQRRHPERYVPGYIEDDGTDPDLQVTAADFLDEVDKADAVEHKQAGPTDKADSAREE